LIASHAPSSTELSQALLSTATLGQNPLRPSSAKERLAREEDRNVRRGIAAVKRRGIDVDESESEDDVRPREKIVEIVRTAGVQDANDDAVKATVIPQRNKKAERAAKGKGVMPRKVCVS
jgi:ATP-dependent RNA helicase DHX37/DHR1